MKKIEVTGKTVEDALTNASIQLKTSSDNLEYEVIEKGSNGLFGIFNSKPAKILVSRKKEAEELASQFEKIENSENTDVKEEAKKEAKKENQDKQIKQVKEKTESEEESGSGKAEVEQKVRKFINDILTSMDLEVTIEFEYKGEDSIEINLIGNDMGVLIGKRGQTLDSLQYLISLVANKESGRYYRVKLDTENYRERRKATLESLAKNIAYKVKRTRRPVSLEPMNPYERRIIHAALQNDKYVSTRSEGEEPFRHVVVFMKK